MPTHGTDGTPRIRRNDYNTLDCPPLAEWTPTEQVSVVIPAHQDQAKLDLTLAALAAQSYPEELMEVVVVDDGSTPPLELPERRPRNTSLLPNRPGHWASASAVDTAIRASSGPIVLRLDADVLPDRCHVEAHARWHHRAEYLTVMGKIAFVEADPAVFDPGTVQSAVAADKGIALFDGYDVEYKWVIKFVEETNGLRDDERRAFSAANGASISFRRTLYDACGGLDIGMRLGADTELGYRLAQAGAVFVPDAAAGAWHIGLSQMRRQRSDGTRYRQPFLAQRVPTFRYMRTPRSGVNWKVPYVEVLLDVANATLEETRTTVDSILGGSITDVAVTMVGPWDQLGSERNALLDDPLVDLRLIHESFSADPRVRFEARRSEDPAPVPFRLVMPVGLEIARRGIEALTDLAEKRRAGLVRLAVSDGESRERSVALERTAALARARLVRREGESLESAVTSIWGVHREDGSSWFLATRDGRDHQQISQTERRVQGLRDSERELLARVDRWRKAGNRARTEAKEWEQVAREWSRAAEWWEGRSKSAQQSGGRLRRAARRVKRRLLG
ncbi:glycosyltransferase family 2 protein [Glycomyces tarimensis]